MHIPLIEFQPYIPLHTTLRSGVPNEGNREPNNQQVGVTGSARQGKYRHSRLVRPKGLNAH
jgi:hypothetical protein